MPWYYWLAAGLATWIAVVGALLVYLIREAPVIEGEM